jgi:dienelactone hydrolase
MRNTLSAVTLALTFASALHAQQPLELPGLLAYPPVAAADVRVLETRTEGDVVVQDLTFPSASGGPAVEAYLVRPAAASDDLAAVLFVHWFEPEAPNSNRTQFLDEARALAGRGVVSLLVSTFWSDTARYSARRWQDDFENSLGQARDLRRALDVLLAQPGVDPERVGFVGHDYGGMFGVLVASVDPRPRACVLIALAPTFPEWYLFGSSTGVPQGEDEARFRERFATIDPGNVIGRVRCAVFLQFGENDRYTPRDGFLALYRAAPEPKRIATYPSGHAMDAAIITTDRTEWLAAQLNLNR